MSDIEISVKANFTTKISLNKLFNIAVLILSLSSPLIYNAVNTPAVNSPLVAVQPASK